MSEQLVLREYKGHGWAWPSISFSIRRRVGGVVGVEQPSDCPLVVSVARRYWWVRWAGLRVGAWPMLELTLMNQSPQAVHSFTLRFVAGPGGATSGTGTQPEEGLSPGATFSHTSQEPDAGCVAACVDFVQFVNGDAWYSGALDSLVTEAGVKAGARAASNHLQRVLARADAATVMVQLARIHADITEPVTRSALGPFGFYNGVSNTAVRLQHAFDHHGLRGVEALLRFDRASG
jgi:hypothetical protein